MIIALSLGGSSDLHWLHIFHLFVSRGVLFCTFCSFCTYFPGLFCDDCADGYWGLSGDGCHPCACDLAGSEPGTICDKVTGQCVCKANTQGRKCDECVDAFYSLKSTNKQVGGVILETGQTALYENCIVLFILMWFVPH